MALEGAAELVPAEDVLAEDVAEELVPALVWDDVATGSPQEVSASNAIAVSGMNIFFMFPPSFQLSDE